MRKKVAILQPNYIPWKGYFDLINRVDEFVIFDEVQYTAKDWRNRNLIKTPAGVQWLTIPVKVNARSQKIFETETENQHWRAKHWKSLLSNYAKAKCFRLYAEPLEALYLSDESANLVDIDLKFMSFVCQVLGITTRISLSTSIPASTEGRMGRIREILAHTEAEVFINGPKAKSFMPDNSFEDMGIGLECMSYEGYPEYFQFHPPFAHGVSILDLLFHCGEDAKRQMLSF